MRQLLLTAGVVCAVAGFAGPASAQVNTMPGQVVSTGFNSNVNAVGTQIPKAAPAQGKPINIPNDSQFLRRYDPSRPYDAFKGTNLNVDQIVAPIPLPNEQSTFDKVSEKLKSVFGVTKAVEPQRSTYFPSLTRRNRERAEERLWRRD
jgi:hypothetical protein